MKTASQMVAFWQKVRKACQQHNAVALLLAPKVASANAIAQALVRAKNGNGHYDLPPEARKFRPSAPQKGPMKRPDR